MPWLRGEATGLPGLRTANLQRDHRSRLESSSFSLRPMEGVKLLSPFGKQVIGPRGRPITWWGARRATLRTINHTPYPL